MDAPCISVIMGVYNCPSEEMLERAVRSVLEQTFSDFEFIICDDGSDNMTYEWLKKAADRDSRIKLIRNEKNMSLAVSLNRCIEISKGKYIARQDIDDYSYPDRFMSQVNFLEENPGIDGTGCCCDLFDKDGVYSGWDMPPYPEKDDFLFNSPFIHGTMMFRKSVFDKSGKYRPCGKNRKYEDYDLFMRMYEKGIKLANLPERYYAFFYDRGTRRVAASMRIDEFFVRLEGFRRLKLFPKGFIYLIKPLIIGIMPHKLLKKLKTGKCR